MFVIAQESAGEGGGGRRGSAGRTGEKKGRVKTKDKYEIKNEG